MNENTKTVVLKYNAHGFLQKIQDDATSKRRHTQSDYLTRLFLTRNSQYKPF